MHKYVYKILFVSTGAQVHSTQFCKINRKVIVIVIVDLFEMDRGKKLPFIASRCYK